jgi:hypothetical protein
MGRLTRLSILQFGSFFYCLQHNPLCAFSVADPCSSILSWALNTRVFSFPPAPVEAVVRRWGSVQAPISELPALVHAFDAQGEVAAYDSLAIFYFTAYTLAVHTAAVTLLWAGVRKLAPNPSPQAQLCGA